MPVLYRWALLAIAILPWLAATPPVLAAPADVRVLIDVSGSMRHTDPDNLRKPAMELLVGLYPLDSYGGFWSFGQGVDVLVPYGRVDQRWRERALAAAGRIHSRSPYTDIPLALETAAFDLDRRREGQISHIILLTDGFVDVGPADEEDAAAVRYLLDELLPALRRGGYVLHTVALSEFADHELMERLAIDSGGMALVARRAEELSRLFLAALERAAPASELPLEGRQFHVDEGVRELTLLVLQEEGDAPVQLTTPDGTRHAATDHAGSMRWQSGEGYELVTASSPMVGSWELAASPEPGSRVTIVSDLRLAIEPLQASRFSTADAELRARLEDRGEPVRDPGFLGVMRVHGEVRRVQGERQWRLDLTGGQRTPAGGLYRAPLPMLSRPGEYEIVVQVDGGTFRRLERRRVSVLLPFDARLSREGESVILDVHMLHPDVDLAASELLVRVRTPDDQGVGQHLTRSAERRWQARFDDWSQPGTYELYLEVSGRFLDGRPLDFMSEDFRVHVGGEAGAEVVEATPPPKPVRASPGDAPADPVPTAATTDGTGLSWWFYALIALGHLLIAGLAWGAWRLVRDEPPGELELAFDSPAEKTAGDPFPESPLEDGVTRDQTPEVDGKATAAGHGAADDPLAAEEAPGVASLLDSLEDPLDLPEDMDAGDTDDPEQR